MGFKRFQHQPGQISSHKKVVEIHRESPSTVFITHVESSCVHVFKQSVCCVLTYRVPPGSCMLWLNLLKCRLWILSSTDSSHWSPPEEQEHRTQSLLSNISNMMFGSVSYHRSESSVFVGTCLADFVFCHKIISCLRWSDLKLNQRAEPPSDGSRMFFC